MKGKRGFTLIEVVVAVAIFSMLIAVFASSLVGSIRSQQKALASQELIDSVSYVLEYMSRALRMAKKDMAGDCITAKNNYQMTREGKGLKFMNYDGVCQEFFWNDGDYRLYEVKGAGDSLAMTPGGLKIASFSIGGEGTWGQNQIPLTQPKVTLSSKIEKRNDDQLFMNIQTTISQRNLNKFY